MYECSQYAHETWEFFVIDSQVFLDLADKEMKQINALFREVIERILHIDSWDKDSIIQFCLAILELVMEHNWYISWQYS